MTAALLERPTPVGESAADSAPSVDPLDTAATPKRRDGFLDAVRAVALIRVIVWHTLAVAAISWFVASMPAMFFVAGSLLARSLDKRPWRQLLTTRLRRLLLPFWAFGAVVLSFLLLVARLHPSAATVIHPMSLLAWLVPLVDPHGSAWEGGWASAPLWYLRCYLWLLLLSPLLRKAHRRWGLRVLIVPLVGIFVIDFLIRHPEYAPAGFAAAKYYLGDLATFSFFWMLGFSHSDGALSGLGRAARLEWAAIGGAAAVVWVEFVKPPTLVVNDSYPLFLFVGIAWLAVFLAFDQWISKAASRGFTARVVAWLGRRSMTIYLWHPIAIVGGYWLRAEFAPNLPRPLVLIAVFPLTLLLTVLFGRVEDYAAGRPAEWWPGKADPAPLVRVGHRLRRFIPQRLTSVRSMVVGGVIAVLVLNVLVPTSSGAEATSSPTSGSNGLALPPAPSAKPDAVSFTDSGATSSGSSGSSTVSGAAADPSAGSSAAASAAAPVGSGSGSATSAAGSAGSGATGASGPSTAIAGGVLANAQPPSVGAATAPTDVAATTAKIQAAVNTWRKARGVAGVQLGVMYGTGTQITLTSGTATDGSALDPRGQFPVTSVTKTMTSAITLRLVQEGKIKLDDPLPVLTAVPNLPYAGKVTIRQLLDHTAGVMPYDDSPGYQAVKGEALTPETALALIVNQPLQWAPGTKVGYSNSGFLTLGLLDQQLAGSDYPNLLQEYVFGPAGMQNSKLDTVPTAGWSGFSAGGVVSTVPDLLKWGNALYRQEKVIDSQMLGQMLDISNTFNAGLGAFPICPCQMHNGVKVYRSIGHNGGQATIQWDPAQDLVLALNLTESMWTSHLTQQDVAGLLTAVEAAATS